MCSIKWGLTQLQMHSWVKLDRRRTKSYTYHKLKVGLKLIIPQISNIFTPSVDF